MSDDELEQQGQHVRTMYFDGFGRYRKVNGVLRCTGFIIGSGAQLNLIVSLAGAEMANRETKRVLAEHQAKGLTIWGDAATAH